MKESYIKKADRKKILLLTDDIRVHSGVAQIGREVVTNTAHRYNWVQLAGAIKHPDKGKVFDLSTDTNNVSGLDDSSVKLYPVDGYGNPDLLREIIKMEKPDAIFIITDPRYFTWLFQIENEIRKKMPIIYLNIWDDYPAPLYNKAYYDYELLLEQGVAKELARNVLPQGLFTKFMYKANARSIMNFISLRNADEAMLEIRECAVEIENIFKEHLPITHAAFIKNGRTAP